MWESQCYENEQNRPERFGPFNDPYKYSGFVPTVAYIISIYLIHHNMRKGLIDKHQNRTLGIELYCFVLLCIALYCFVLFCILLYFFVFF